MLTQWVVCLVLYSKTYSRLSIQAAKRLPNSCKQRYSSVSRCEAPAKPCLVDDSKQTYLQIISIATLVLKHPVLEVLLRVCLQYTGGCQHRAYTSTGVEPLRIFAPSRQEAQHGSVLAAHQQMPGATEPPATTASRSSPPAHATRPKLTGGRVGNVEQLLRRVPHLSDYPCTSVRHCRLHGASSKPCCRSHRTHRQDR